MQVIKRAALATVAGNLMVAGHAAAASEVATLAGDSRVNLLLSLFVPLAGWVLFNIAGPAKTQYDQMRLKSVPVAAGLGLAGLMAANSADAAQEVAMVADQRVNILLTLFVPLVGWVLFNIGGPALNQLNVMQGRNSDPRSKRGINQKPGTRN